MGYANKLFSLFVFAVFIFIATDSLANKGQLEWRVETDFEKLELVPAYAGENTPFTVKEKPRSIKKRVVKIERPEELNEDQVLALRAADILNEIREVLSKEEIFNADTSTLNVNAVMSIDGIKSALIKNRWYEEGAKLEVPVAAKETLLSLVDTLKDLDQNLAEIVETQVQEKIQIVKNLSLTLERIDDNQVHFTDEQGKKHVINFKIRSF